MIRRLLLIAALLVAGVAPARAQSDNRWIAVFQSSGQNSKGTDRTSGNLAKVYISTTNHTVVTMLERMGIPYKVLALPDSAGGWAASIGDTRDTDEADSTHFRKNGCMGWVHVMDEFSTSDGTSEIAEFFTDAEGNTGVQRGSPADGVWGIPGLILTIDARSNAGLSILNGVAGRTQKASTARVRQAFANGDSVSIQTVFAAHVPAEETANVTRIIHADTLNGTGSSVLAWRYKTSVLYYLLSDLAYQTPQSILLGMADLIGRAGYVPRRKLNLHIDLDHPYPDATVKHAPTDSFLVYFDALPFRHGGAIEASAAERVNDYVPLVAKMNARKDKFPSHVHSHDYLNFGSTDIWNQTTFADSATKRARWNLMKAAIRDTIGSALGRGYEYTATFPNNVVHFPDLYIMASDGMTNVRSRAALTDGAQDSVGAPSSNLRRWRQVPGPRLHTTPTITSYGLPYAYIEPKTNRLLYVHDSFEHPTSSDTLYTGATDFGADIESFSSRSLSGFARMAIWDGGQYWHPDLNLTSGRFMADFYRRLTYFYGRTKNILTVEPIYRPRTPRRGGTARSF